MPALLALAYLLALAAVLLGLLALKRPSNARTWKPDMARPPEADVSGDALTLHHVRDNRYGAPGTPYETRYETRTYDLSRLRRVWFAVESFSRFEVVAHTLLSFEFEGGVYLAFSAEARLQDGERYDILRGLFNHFELMYTLGDERDFVLRRSVYQDHDVYLYPLALEPTEVRALLADILQTANALRQSPRFYNSAFANCTSLLFDHVNRVRPGSFAWHRPERVLPGLSDRLLWRKGWIAGVSAGEALEPMRARHNVRAVTQRLADDPAVPVRMREQLSRG